MKRDKEGYTMPLHEFWTILNRALVTIEGSAPQVT